MDPSALFFEVHHGLPREAPGDTASTLRALRAMTDLPPAPSILHIGCGPGAQTIALALGSSAHICALDIHLPFLLELTRRAARAGVDRRIAAVNASMFDLPFGEPFDALWSEGAVYVFGFEQGLQAWRRLVKPHGYVAVTELSWIRPEPPAEICDHGRSDYPGMAAVDENLTRLERAGYRAVELFILPESAWWEPYYHPMERRVDELRRKYRDNPHAQRLLDIKSGEIEMYRKYSAWYGYVFYVMQRLS